MSEIMRKKNIIKVIIVFRIKKIQFSQYTIHLRIDRYSIYFSQSHSIIHLPFQKLHCFQNTTNEKMIKKITIFFSHKISRLMHNDGQTNNNNTEKLKEKNAI